MDENGLFELRERFGDVGNTYSLRDVRRENSINMHGIDTVFHCAALKHVDICEQNAWQAVLTNVYGTRNVISQAIDHGVKTFVLVSTDKAVNPIGVMGATKLLAEKLMHWNNSRIKLITVRFGNIWASRGSLYTRIKHQIETGNPITVTDPNMQRYYFSIQEAAEFIIKASEEGKNGEIWIPKMELKSLDEIIDKIVISVSKPGERSLSLPRKIIGIRPGEKLVEELYTEQEKSRLIDHDSFYVIPPLGY